ARRARRRLTQLSGFSQGTSSIGRQPHRVPELEVFMSPSLRLRKGLMAVAALGALALGGSALADAATSGGSTTSGSSSSGSSNSTQQQPPQGGPRDPTKPGGHRGGNGQVE